MTDIIVKEVGTSNLYAINLNEVKSVTPYNEDNGTFKILFDYGRTLYVEADFKTYSKIVGAVIKKQSI